MSRWTEEEDKYILELLLESKDELNYKEMVEKHNSKLNKQRNEDTYKVRVRKVIKDNNIEIKTNNHWSEADKEYIIKTVQQNPYENKWNEIAEYLKRPEISIKKIYNEMVSAEEHLKCYMSSINEEEIIKMMNTYEHNCKKCSKRFYSSAFIWDNDEYCEECFNVLYSKIIIDRWNKVREYSIIKNKTSCNICKKEANFDNSIVNRFHYDHIDMFDKNDSICRMVRTGEVIDNIYNEIDKCQLLCLSCHTIITKLEHNCGFIRIKKNISKEYTESNDENKKKELIKQYSEKYNNFMSIAYNIIKKII
jgi:hypothetical protein